MRSKPGQGGQQRPTAVTADWPKLLGTVTRAEPRSIEVNPIVVVGRGVAEGVIELRNRKSGERREVTIANAVAELGHT